MWYQIFKDFITENYAKHILMGSGESNFHNTKMASLYQWLFGLYNKDLLLLNIGKVISFKTPFFRSLLIKI